MLCLGVNTDPQLTYALKINLVIILVTKALIPGKREKCTKHFLKDKE